MQSEVEEKIRVVIRVFQYVGWPFAVLFVPMAIFALILSVVAAIWHPQDLLIFLWSAGISVLLASIFVWMLKVARRMKMRDRTARGPAGILSAMMLPFFPLFTIVGLVCLYRVYAYYGPYCEEAAQQLTTIAPAFETGP